MTKTDKILSLFVVAATIAMIWFGSYAPTNNKIAEAYTAGKIDGFKEAQSADLIADRCVAFWFLDTRESTKALDRFCKRKEK